MSCTYTFYVMYFYFVGHILLICWSCTSTLFVMLYNIFNENMSCTFKLYITYLNIVCHVLVYMLSCIYIFPFFNKKKENKCSEATHTSSNVHLQPPQPPTLPIAPPQPPRAPHMLLDQRCR